MASTYVNDLRLEEIGTGEQSGTWGDTTNTNLELIAEAFGFGTEAITTNADTHTTTVADGATDPGRSIFLKYTGTLDSTCTITLAPNTISKLWFIHNATSGSQSIIITQGSGANVTIATGQTKAVYTDGAGSGAVVTDAFATLSIVDLLVDDDLTVVDDVAIGGLATVGGTLGVTGVLTANAGVVVDTMTLDAATLTATGDFTVDSAGDIILDADGQQIILKDGGTTFAEVYQSSNNLFIEAKISDGDILFRGNDGGSDITALTLDMSAAGAAAFNGVLTANAGVVVDEMTLDGDTLTATDTFTIDAVDDITLNSDNSGRILFGDASILYGIVLNSSSNFVLEVGTNDKDMLFKGQDGGASITALTLDMSAAGQAQFTNGTDALPSISFASDPDTGIRRGGTNNLAFVANGATRTYIDASTHLATSTAGTSNLALGVNAGAAIVSGANYNTLIGDEAGDLLVSGGVNNTAVGYQALTSEDGNGNATAIGFRALGNQNAGAESYNVAVGVDAGLSLTTAVSTTLVGAFAGGGATLTGASNTAIGRNAGYVLTSGGSNSLVGSLAGDALTEGNFNCVLGSEALTADTLGTGSIAIGRASLEAQNFTSATDTENTAVGNQAGLSNTTGQAATFIGHYSGRFATTADATTFVGANAGRGVTNAKLTGNNNTAIGTSAGILLQGAAAQNTLIGSAAGDSVTTGTSLTILGYNAGQALEGATRTTCIGDNAGASVTTNDNTFIGQNSGNEVSNGDANTYIGRFNGNQHSLDLRASSNNIVLSDGDGNPQLYYSSGGWLTNGKAIRTQTSTVQIDNGATTDVTVPHGVYFLQLRMIISGVGQALSTYSTASWFHSSTSFMDVIQLGTDGGGLTATAQAGSSGDMIVRVANGTGHSGHDLNISFLRTI